MHTDTHTYIYAYVYMHVYMYTCTYKLIHIHKHIHTCTYIQTCAHTYPYIQVREKATAAWWRWRHTADPREHVIYKYVRPNASREASERERGIMKAGGGRGSRAASVPPMSDAEQAVHRLRKLVLEEEDGAQLRDIALEQQLQFHRLLMDFQVNHPKPWILNPKP